MSLLLKSTTKTCAALPWRKAESGEMQLLLIAPRRENKWTIPSAEIDGVSAPADIAQRAAFRRAGIIGVCFPTPLSQEMTGQDSLEIFTMRVKGSLVAWPERKLWRRDWLSPEAAAKRVHNASLANLITTVADNPTLLSEE